VQRFVRAVATGVVLAIAIEAAAAPPAQRPKLDRALWYSADHARDADPVDVIIAAEAYGFAALRARLEQHGDRIVDEQPQLSLLTVRLHAADLQILEADVSVRHLSANALVDAAAAESTATGAAPNPARGALLDTLGLTGAVASGRRVGVAVIDSGIQPAADLTVDDFYDFTRGGEKAAPYDDYGHGTHVSGLIGGHSSGVAPGVRLVGLKVLDHHGQGRVSDVVRAIEFAVANRRRLRIDVLNLSLGHPSTEPPQDDPLVQAVERATRAGLIVVASAGNAHVAGVEGASAFGDVTSPGTAPSAITVGAIDTHGTPARTDDTVAGYSSRGSSGGIQKPDVAAPGANLVSNAAQDSWLYAEYPERRVADAQGASRLFRLSGTSMAAAVTSGVVALLIEEHRRNASDTLTPNLVKAILQFSALPLPGDAAASGAGALNAAGALELAGSRGPTGPAGEWAARLVVPPFTAIAGTQYVWGQTVIWGTTVIWGNAVYVNEPAWSSSAVWGQTVIWGTAVR
jgi:serine protease AprX